MGTDLPLHPAVVHLPLALAFLLPLLATGALLAWWREWLPGRRAWAAVVAFQLLLGFSTFAAMRTGETEEERVEAVVAEHFLETHEEQAETFRNATLVVAVLAMLPLVLPREGLRRSFAVLTVAGTFVVGGLAFETGQHGGELVYRHGAASAYGTSGGAARSPLPFDDDD